MDDADRGIRPPSTTTSGRVKTSITLPRSLLRRIRRVAALNKRDMSFEIEVAMEEHVSQIENALGLSAATLRDED